MAVHQLRNVTQKPAGDPQENNQNFAERWWIAEILLSAGKLGQTAHRSVCRRRNPRLRRQRRKTSVLTEKPVKHSKLSQFTLFRLRKVSFLSKNQLVADGNSVSRDTGAYATRSALAVALRRFKSASSARQAAGTLQPRALSRYKPT